MVCTIHRTNRCNTHDKMLLRYSGNGQNPNDLTLPPGGCSIGEKNKVLVESVEDVAGCSGKRRKATASASRGNKERRLLTSRC